MYPRWTPGLAETRGIFPACFSSISTSTSIVDPGLRFAGTWIRTLVPAPGKPAGTAASTKLPVPPGCNDEQQMNENKQARCWQKITYWHNQRKLHFPLDSYRNSGSCHRVLWGQSLLWICVSKCGRGRGCRGLPQQVEGTAAIQLRLCSSSCGSRACQNRSICR